MTTTNATIAIVPSSQFKWRAQVQYKETLETRDDAVLYASKHGCNLIVEYGRRTGAKFDVLVDPELAVPTETESEFAETVPVVEMPESGGWSKRVLRRMFSLGKRHDVAPSN